MINRLDIIKKGREYLGTPFVHQSRLKGIGIDCIGLVTGVAKELEIFTHDHTVYSRYSDGTLLMHHMLKVFDIAPIEDRLPGDVIIYWIDRQTKHPQHVGILTETGIIHTYDRVEKVVETTIQHNWEKRMTHCLKWRGIDQSWPV